MNDELREIQKLQKVPALHPSLQAVADEAGLDIAALSVVADKGDERQGLGSRDKIAITDGEKVAVWQVESLRDLFRGNRRPPEMPAGTPPRTYLHLFSFIERSIPPFCQEFGDKTDQEFERVFNDLRRRPDGAPRDELHAYLWQVAALLAGCFELSALEYEAIFDRLRRSARTFSMAPVSRNYVRVLRST
jgi:hypothetical protein